MAKYGHSAFEKKFAKMFFGFGSRIAWLSMKQSFAPVTFFTSSPI